MKAWRLNGPEQLEMISDTSASVDNPSLVKVKIEMCDLSYTDKINYDKGTKKPTILGRHGVGLISEVFDENCFLKKSDRVVIDPMMPCGNCFDCKTGNSKNCMYKYKLGVNCDGLQADFITLPIESIHKLPLTIPFETAMFTEYVAMAINIINKIDIEKGDHVAILASNKIGNIVGQLVAYYQGIPVIIDDNESALTAARDAGVNYTFNTTKSDVVDEVFSITGGRMCEKVVYLTNTPQNLQYALQLCACNGIICAFGADEITHTTDFGTICKKQLSILTANSGYGSFSNAINLLANKAVKINSLIDKTVDFNSLNEIYKQTDTEALKYKSILAVIK